MQDERSADRKALGGQRAAGRTGSRRYGFTRSDAGRCRSPECPAASERAAAAGARRASSEWNAAAAPRAQCAARRGRRDAADATAGHAATATRARSETAGYGATAAAAPTASGEQPPADADLSTDCTECASDTAA